MRRVFLTALVLSTMSLSVASGQEPPRVGWEESFEKIDRWRTALLNPVHGSPVAVVEALNGSIRIVTQVGALNPQMRRADWPEWPEKPHSSFTNFQVQYDDAVDLDLYRYLVVHVREKSTFLGLRVNGKPTKVCYTTGVHAQDLRALGLKGRQRLTFWGQFLNTAGHVVLESIRLVRALTPEEQKGFISEGLTIRSENRTAHPYHRLEALNARVGRPRRTEGSEWCVYRDTGTGAEVWKMTDMPGNEYNPQFNSDGSALTLAGRSRVGIHIFDWVTRAFTPLEGGLRDAAPLFSTTEPSVMIVAENEWLRETPGQRRRRVTLYRYDFRTGERHRIAAFEPKSWAVQEFVSSPDSSKLLFGLRESPVVFAIDPDVEDEAQRVREIHLTTRLKGVHWANQDREIHWFNCYTYQPLFMDLATGRVSQGNYPSAGGHSAGGPHWTISPYGNLLKLLVRNGLHPQTEATADHVRIFANYKEPVATDYGHISRDGKWMVTDGVSGDVLGQHLLIPIGDPASVLRVCFHNTSRNDWSTNTYSSTSPDTTKLAWVSDQFDNGDIYIAVTGRPAPPTNLQAKRAGDRVSLSWQPPEGARENGGYRVYRSSRSGRGFRALNVAPVREAAFVDETAPQGPAFYLVAMVEPSGLEGHFSNEAAVGVAAATPRTFLLEAELGQWRPPLREVLDGAASGSRYLRAHRAAPEEPEQGRLECRLSLPAGRYAVWVRGRAEDGPASGSWTYGDQSGAFRLESGDEFRWTRGEGALALNREGPVVLTLAAAADGLAIDQIALTSDRQYDPNAPLTEGTAPARALAPLEVTADSVRLQWEPSPTPNLARYDVHASGDSTPDALGNETIIGSTTETTFYDWGLKPDTEQHYQVVAVDTRGNHSEPLRVSVRTRAKPVQVAEAALVADERLDRVTFTFEVTAEGPYMLWARYAPGYVRSLTAPVEINGRQAGEWNMRAPYAPMGWTLAAGGNRPQRVWTDKVVLGGEDVFHLPKGRHTLSFVLDPSLGEQQHRFERLFLSNDQSWRPEGYDPRANFTKRR